LIAPSGPRDGASTTTSSGSKLLLRGLARANHNNDAFQNDTRTKNQWLAELWTMELSIMGLTHAVLQQLALSPFNNEQHLVCLRQQ
jgi:hypothetical protein